jgi:hypothetical protein
MINPESHDKLIHVDRPMKRVKLTFEPTSPFDGSVVDGTLINVGKPMKHLNATFGSEVSICLELTLTLHPETDKTTVASVFEKLTALVDLLTAYETELGGVGFAVDAAKSGVKPGPTVALVLVPNDSNGVERRLTKVAELLAKATSEYPSKTGVLAQVFSMTEPFRILFTIAA